MLSFSTEDLEVGVVVAPRRSVVAVRALVGVSGDGVVERDDEVVDGPGPPGLWRIAYPTDPEIPEAEVLASDEIQRRLEELFPFGGEFPLN